MMRELEDLAAELPAVDTEDLPRFEVLVRSRWRYAHREPLVGHIAGVHALGFLSFHSNGYRREEAVERLAYLYDDAALRYLILRMSDWVPEVRERAWAENGHVSSRPVLRLCATFDHRVIDGSVGAEFTYALIRYLDNPDTLLLEMV